MLTEKNSYYPAFSPSIQITLRARHYCTPLEKKSRLDKSIWRFERRARFLDIDGCLLPNMDETVELIGSQVSSAGGSPGLKPVTVSRNEAANERSIPMAGME